MKRFRNFNKPKQNEEEKPHPKNYFEVKNINILKFNLLDIPVVFICPDHNEKYRERKLYMFDFLQKLGFKDVTMFKSGAEKYPLCLAKATYDVLSSRLDDSPFLLLEDDIEATEWFHTILEYPENTDAFYIGFSKCGGSKTIDRWEGSSQIEYITTRYIRILNMLSAHAIVYVSKQYKESVMNEMNKIIEDNIVASNDVPISRLHETFNILGYHYPLFFQSEKFGNTMHVKNETNFRFYQNTKFTVVTAYYPTKTKKHSKDEYMIWILNFFNSIDCDVICFCPVEYEKIFKKIAKPNHEIIVREFDSWDMMSPSQMKKWDEFYKIDPEENHSPDLYAVWAAKQEFVREAMNIRNDDIFIWCDSGYFRTEGNIYFNRILDFINGDKITYLKVDNKYIGGGILLGTKTAWIEFSKKYLEELEKNLCGKEQDVYARILNENTATEIKAPRSLDQWFYFRKLLK